MVAQYIKQDWTNGI